MTRRRFHLRRLTLPLVPVLAAILVSLASAPIAAALGDCEVSEKSDGTLQISAKKVQGTLRFGTSPRIIQGRFSNEATCREGRKATKCTVADKGEVERTTHPPFCRYHLEDDEESCTAKVKSCSPGLRPTCPPDMERMGDACVERLSSGDEYAEAVAECAARGRSMCTQSEIMECDMLNLSSGRRGSCGDLTDGGTWVWTLESASEDGQSVFGRIPVYRDDNRVRENPTDTGSIYQYFCCAALGTP